MANRTLLDVSIQISDLTGKINTLRRRRDQLNAERELLVADLADGRRAPLTAARTRHVSRGGRAR